MSCLITQRQLQQSKHSGLMFWRTAQAEPCFQLEMNFFTYSNTQLVNIRGKMSKIIFRLDGSAFARLLPLVTTIAKILNQAVNVFLANTDPVPLNEKVREVSRREIPVFVKKVNVVIQDFELDLILEKVPEMISSLSNDYLAKIFSMLFTDICYLPIKLQEFSSDMVINDNRQYKGEFNESTTKLLIHHYTSQINRHIIDVLSNTKLFGNPVKIFANLHEVLLNVFKEGSVNSFENNPKNIIRESFITLFQAHSKATGNYEYASLQNYLISSNDNTKQPLDNSSIAGPQQIANEHGIFSFLSQKTERIQDLLYQIPFAANLVRPYKNSSLTSGDTAKHLINSTKPMRHPRFFFKNRILIPYSSLKAKLQMVVDNKDIENAVKYFVTLDILLHHRQRRRSTRQ